MNENKPSVSRGTQFSAVWIIPVVAVVIGIWMVAHTMMTEGPTITIDFKTAEGLEAGKTKIRVLSHETGLVEDVVLKPDVSGVTATVKLEREAKSLLRQDTRFWVVRARVAAGGVSGLGTLLSGAYIEMAPGSSKVQSKTFVGLEEPPLTPVGAPGIRLTLFSNQAGSVSTGNTVLFQGYGVGRIEATTFDTERQLVQYDIFIDAPFHKLIHHGTRFWDVSGISVNASASGIQVKTGSMETILLGGVSFATPPGIPAGSPVTDHTEYMLYSSYDEILENPYTHGTYYVVSFKQSLRGLIPGAPVEYRGIQVGQVKRILVKELAQQGMEGTGKAIPVLIYLEPGRLQIPDTVDSLAKLRADIKKSVRNGMRATLQTGNLLTGQQLISIDYYPDEDPKELGQFEQYTTIPTIETGVDRLETQVNSLLEKLNALPLEETVIGANKAIASADVALVSLKTTLDSTNNLLINSNTEAMPDELVATLKKTRLVLDGFTQNAELYKNLNASLRTLDATLNNTQVLTRKLADKPNAVLLPASTEPDPIPKARPQ